MVLATPHQILKEGSDQLAQDLEAVYEYCTKWGLKANPSKSEISAFHLSNKLAHEKLHVMFGGEYVIHSLNPRYLLGVMLDRSLTLRQPIRLKSEIIIYISLQ